MKDTTVLLHPSCHGRGPRGIKRTIKYLFWSTDHGLRIPILSGPRPVRMDTKEERLFKIISRTY